MKRALTLAIFLAYALNAATSAQQVGDNINVLPVFQGIDQLDYLRGDLYGQRQNEPSVVVSSLNKDHIAVFYNDFRAVDVPNDPPLPGLQSSTIAGRLWKGTRSLFAKLLGMEPPERKGAPVVALEAGIGMSVSYDGGLTWTGGFMPGLPFDQSPASVKSPGFGLEGMSDPVAAGGACGRFYVAYLQFSRITGQSKLMVARFQDLNDHDLRHTIKFLGASALETGMNAENGHFVDKPEMTTRMTGATSCSQVTEHVFVTYTTFSGQGTADKFQSRINIASSTNLGQTWTKAKVDDSYKESQGTAVVTHPTTGQVSVIWRSFNSPHTMAMSRSTNSGGWSKPVDLLANDPLKTLANFDQRGVATTELPTAGMSIQNELAFRSNAFPVAAFTPDGSALIVAWHEKVSGQDPNVNGSPRIVWKYSRDGGTTWSQRKALVNDRPASPGGLGFFNPTASAPFPQVMPSITCGAGTPNRCVVTYYEARGGLSQTGLIAGYNRLLDLRAVMITAPANANPTAGSSFQVSRYAYRPLLENETPQETLDYVQHNCRPDGSNCRAAMHTATDPHTSGGTTPFIGDYNYVAAFEQIMKDSATGVWRLAKTAQDVPGGARFIAAFADNRNVHQPFEDFNHAPLPAGTEWNSYPIYGPAGLGGSCFNPGSRDQNVMTAHISTGLLVTAPTNFKPFQSPRIEFPMTIWNNTGVDRQFDLDLIGNGSFAKEPSTDGSYVYPLKDGGVTIFAYSSASVNVYALDGNKVTVNVTECGLTNCASPVTNPLTGSIAFNAPSAAPPGGTPAFTYSSSDIVVNPVPKNPVPKNPVPKNPVPKNPVPKNAATGEPVPVYDIIDYSWTVNPTSQDDAGTYLALANIDRAYQNDYIFQVFVTKPSTLYSALNCQPGNLALGTLIGHISDPQNPVPKNPVPKNPVPKNPVPKNATLSDQLVSNTTFTLESSDTVTAPTAFSATGAVSAVAGLGCDPTTGAGLIGECTMAAPRPPNETTITVRAYQITQNPSAIFDPHGDITGTATPPSVTVADYWCTSAAEGCAFAQDGPDLAVPVPPADPATNVTPTTVRAGQTVTFPVTPANVFNIGNQPAKEHRLGYYISAASTIATLPRRSDGTLDTSSSVYTLLLRTVDLVPLAAGSFETITSQTLTVPADIPRPNNGQGTYYLYAFDDDLRRVNELNEDNNIIQGGPITVVAAGYTGIIGLFSPCSGLSCQKSAGSAMPLAFQLTFDGTTAANSQATKPRFRVYAPGPGGACVTSVPSNGSGYLFLADNDNVSSGNSLWQYFPTSGTRPAFTWQYNFQGKNPTTGATLALGCYSFFVEIPAFGQTVASGGAVTRLSIRMQ